MINAWHCLPAALLTQYAWSIFCAALGCIFWGVFIKLKALICCTVFPGALMTLTNISNVVMSVYLSVCPWEIFVMGIHLIAYRVAVMLCIKYCMICQDVLHFNVTWLAVVVWEDGVVLTCGHHVLLLGAGTALGWRTCPALSPTTVARRGWSRTLRTGSPALAPLSLAPSASWPSSQAPTSVRPGILSGVRQQRVMGLGVGFSW